MNGSAASRRPGSVLAMLVVMTVAPLLFAGTASASTEPPLFDGGGTTEPQPPLIDGGGTTEPQPPLIDGGGSGGSGGGSGGSGGGSGGGGTVSCTEHGSQLRFVARMRDGAAVPGLVFDVPYPVCSGNTSAVGGTVRVTTASGGSTTRSFPYIMCWQCRGYGMDWGDFTTASKAMPRLNVGASTAGFTWMVQNGYRPETTVVHASFAETGRDGSGRVTTFTVTVEIRADRSATPPPPTTAPPTTKPPTTTAPGTTTPVAPGPATPTPSSPGSGTTLPSPGDPSAGGPETTTPPVPSSADGIDLADTLQDPWVGISDAFDRLGAAHRTSSPGPTWVGVSDAFDRLGAAHRTPVPSSTAPTTSTPEPPATPDRPAATNPQTTDRPAPGDTGPTLLMGGVAGLLSLAFAAIAAVRRRR